MALKTRPTAAKLEQFLNAIPDESRRADCRALAKLMQKATKAKPVVWSNNIVGFGTYAYNYKNGGTLEWMRIGFAPRKTDLSLYLFPGPQRAALLKQFGKHKAGQGCVNIKRLADVDTKVLAGLIDDSLQGLDSWLESRKPTR